MEVVGELKELEWRLVMLAVRWDRGGKKESEGGPPNENESQKSAAGFLERQPRRKPKQWVAAAKDANWMEQTRRRMVR
jgi:hypothetical protein